MLCSIFEFLKIKHFLRKKIMFKFHAVTVVYGIMNYCGFCTSWYELRTKKQISVLFSDVSSKYTISPCHAAIVPTGLHVSLSLFPPFSGEIHTYMQCNNVKEMVTQVL